MQPSVIRPAYNEANLLDRIDANLRGTSAEGELVWTPFVTNIDYDSKGQRQRIDYGNGASTSYEYDPLTFRLTHMLTRRSSEPFPDDCPQPAPRGWPGCHVQNLHYTYDPVGNITRIRDDAQQTIYFRNQRVEPSGEYTYDPLYRLIEATGREHLGQIGGAPVPHSPSDTPRIGIDWSANDGNAMGRYTERYVYDAVGNILEMQHRGGDPARPGWTRHYAYNEPSQIEDGTGGTIPKTSNRLSITELGNNNPPPERYTYDPHGNITRMPHLGGGHAGPNMHWSYRDQLHQVDLGGGSTVYYTYDAGGRRVRKVWEKAPGLVEERIYLGGFEFFRRRNATGGVTRERETLHVMDGTQRIALVETRTRGDDGSPARLIRYQFINHLGSSSLELDDEARIISYEEYTPYGGTSYQAVHGQTETPKRYRFTGKERDEESGLYYHGARYYAPWLGRWTSADPSGVRHGVNTFAFVSGNPINKVDLTGRFEISWTDVAIGAGVALVGVALVAVTAGAAAPLIAAAVGVSTEAVIATGAVIGTGLGVVATARSVDEISTEVQTGRDPRTGAPVSDAQISRDIGSTAVGALATVFGARGIRISGGTPPTGLAPAGGPPGFFDALAVRMPQVAADPLRTSIAVGSGVAAQVPTVMMMSGGGDGEPASGRTEHREPGQGARLRPSLKQQAEEAGVRDVIEEGEFEVFAHGTTAAAAEELISSQGGTLSAGAGNFGGSFFTVPSVEVAEVFAARSAGRIAGQEPAIVGIALPRSISNQLRTPTEGLLRLGPIENPPPGVPPSAQQWIFQPGAFDALKNQGFFFRAR
jgi:RHS repeat-associated protein